jgi:hypothetical protein
MMPASKKTPERIKAIIEGLERGTPLTVICRTIGCDDNTVRDWMSADAELSGAIARARETGFDALAEQALALIDEEPARVEGRIDPGHVQWRRAQVDTRLKLLAKWDPKRYGEQSKLALTGADGGAIKHEVEMASPETMAEMTQALLSAAKGGEK